MHEVGGRIDGEALLARITAADLAAAISRREGSVPKKAGQRLRVRCPSPSHPDSNPSCDVSEKNGRAVWHCWSCGASGNAVTWWRIVNGDAPYPTVLAGLAADFLAGGLTTSVPRSARRTEPPDEREPPDYAAMMRKLRHQVPPDLLEAFAQQKRISTDELSKCDVHAAIRWHRCEPGSCPSAVEDESRWLEVTVVRVPLTTADGSAAGWQDIITRSDADQHFYGQKKRTASGCQFPLAGLADVNRDASRVLLLEGVTDWLTARTAAPEWSSVGALGSERMAEAAAELARTMESVDDTTLVIVGDGDRAGDKGANEAANVWPGVSVRLRPRDGDDLSDIWCAAHGRSHPHSWWQDTLETILEAAAESREPGAVWAAPSGPDCEPHQVFGSGGGQHAVDSLRIWPPEDQPIGEIIEAVLRKVDDALIAIDPNSGEKLGQIPRRSHMGRLIASRKHLSIRPDGPLMKLTARCAAPTAATHRGPIDGCGVEKEFDLVEMAA